MSLLAVVLVSAAALGAAYVFYGSLLARLFRLDPNTPTPAVTQRDDVDFIPTKPGLLLGQHFSAIAAAGPVVGPILAGAYFGWLPALLWILLGSIFIGGVHDLAALIASVRHRARSIAEVVREHMSRQSYILFLIFVWLALVYVIVAFTSITASAFDRAMDLGDGSKLPAGSIATSSLLYLVLPVAMGLLVRFLRMPVGVATAVFLPLVGVAIWIGQYIPLDLGQHLGLGAAAVHRTWCAILLVYCFVASVVPMWLLLQPRGHLGGYFLYVALVGGALGILFGASTLQYPAFRGWVAENGNPLFPFLFITIACGACSGFHAMVASGTTSKQLRTEADARPIAYGGMLLEGMVAVISLCCVMVLAPQAAQLTGTINPDAIYAQGIGGFLAVLGVPYTFAVSFAMMAFTTFIYDTLDVCTRLGRYVLQELLGLHDLGGRLLATALTVGAPLYFLVSAPADPAGRVIPTFLVFWGLFGASNQLLAALTLMGVTVWLWRTRRAMWVWAVTGLPAAWMYVISTWELGRMAQRGFFGAQPGGPVPWVALLLIVLALMMLVEAIRLFLSPGRTTPPAGAVPAAT